MSLVDRPAGVAELRRVRRRAIVVDVGEVHEHLDVPPRRAGHRRQERVVPVGVHRLLVVGVAGVPRADVRLVHPDVTRLERAFGEVDDRRVHVQAVERAAPHERELVAPAMLLGPEPRAVLGHLGIAAPQRRRVLSGRDVARGVVVELVGLREHGPQVGDGGVDHVGVDRDRGARPSRRPATSCYVVVIHPAVVLTAHIVHHRRRHPLPAWHSDGHDVTASSPARRSNRLVIASAGSTSVLVDARARRPRRDRRHLVSRGAGRPGELRRSTSCCRASGFTAAAEHEVAIDRGPAPARAVVARPDRDPVGVRAALRGDRGARLRGDLTRPRRRLARRLAARHQCRRRNQRGQPRGRRALRPRHRVRRRTGRSRASVPPSIRTAWPRPGTPTAASPRSRSRAAPTPTRACARWPGSRRSRARSRSRCSNASRSRRCSWSAPRTPRLRPRPTPTARGRSSAAQPAWRVDIERAGHQGCSDVGLYLELAPQRRRAPRARARLRDVDGRRHHRNRGRPVARHRRAPRADPGRVPRRRARASTPTTATRELEAVSLLPGVSVRQRGSFV